VDEILGTHKGPLRNILAIIGMDAEEFRKLP
jgi:hypothetical protein